MSTEIYYFSGSGNSLAVARDLAGELNAKLISIPSVVDQESVRTDADVIGIVFPVYYASLGGSGVPLIVERFVRKLEDLSSKYILAVCTHQGAPGSTIANLGQMVGSVNGQLAAGYSVRMSRPYSIAVKLKHFLFHGELTVDARKNAADERRLSAMWRSKLEAICRDTNARKKGHFEARGRLAQWMLAPFLKLQNRAAIVRYQKLADSPCQSLDELVPLADRSFHCDPHCSGCGTCARVCPVSNIRMVERKPAWQHHCETCFACFQWCPQGAIGGDIIEYQKRYHHPSVKLADMLGQNGYA